MHTQSHTSIYNTVYTTFTLKFAGYKITYACLCAYCNLLILYVYNSMFMWTGMYTIHHIRTSLICKPVTIGLRCSFPMYISPHVYIIRKNTHMSISTCTLTAALYQNWSYKKVCPKEAAGSTLSRYEHAGKTKVGSHGGRNRSGVVGQHVPTQRPLVAELPSTERTPNVLHHVMLRH